MTTRLDLITHVVERKVACTGKSISDSFDPLGNGADISGDVANPSFEIASEIIQASLPDGFYRYDFRTTL